ncbi:MAG: hypothetical protein JO013_13340 [Alphaproteobacteria bacterium]|nr:hypothetical protein [Alphaproteobacteria bacterium]
MSLDYKKFWDIIRGVGAFLAVAVGAFTFLRWQFAALAVTSMVGVVSFLSIPSHFVALDIGTVPDAHRAEVSRVRNIIIALRKVVLLFLPAVLLAIIAASLAWGYIPAIFARQAVEVVRNDILQHPDHATVEYDSPPATKVFRAPVGDPHLLGVAPLDSREAIMGPRHIRDMELGHVVSETLGDPVAVFFEWAGIIAFAAFVLGVLAVILDAALIGHHTGAPPKESTLHPDGQSSLQG